jgi:hypothetical protein
MRAGILAERIDIYGHLFPGGGDRKELAEASVRRRQPTTWVPLRGDEADSAR